MVCTGRIFAALAACSCLVFLAGCGETNDESAEEIAPVPPTAPEAGRPGVVVSVNGNPLTRAKLDSQVSRIMSQPRMAGQSPEEQGRARTDIEKRFIDHFVVRSLLMSEAKAANISVEDAEIAETVERLKSQLPEGQTMEAALAADGLTMESLQEQLRGDMVAQKVVEQKLVDIPAATDEEVGAFYKEKAQAFQTPESAHARHILFSFDKDADEAAKAEKKKEAEACIAKLADGGDFAKLAEEHSSCPSGKSKGGDLGTFSRGRMVPQFEVAAFSQEIGKVGPLVETPFGYHIIEVIERKEAGVTPLEEVKDKITKHLADQKKRELANAFVDSLKAKAEITYGQ